MTFVAVAADGRPLGLVTAAVLTKLPSSRRPRSRWLHVSLLFVTADARGAGLGAQLLEALRQWALDHDVSRIQLHAAPQARGLYERAGFTAPSAGLREWSRDPAARPGARGAIGERTAYPGVWIRRFLLGSSGKRRVEWEAASRAKAVGPV